MRRTAITTLVLAAGSIAGLHAQTPPPNPPSAPAPPQQGPGGPPPPRGRGQMLGGRMAGRMGPGMRPGGGMGMRGNVERNLQAGPGGRWWTNPEMAQRIGISSDQQKKMDDIFQANRLRLVDLTASLRKEEFVLEPLLQSETPDEPKILAQIDKVAQGRAELEKANARFLLGIRRVLTPDQWKKLQAERRTGMAGSPGPSGPGGPAGPPPARR